MMRRFVSQLSGHQLSAHRISEGMQSMLMDTKNETLKQVSLYYSQGGKYIRPTLNLLLAQSINLTLQRTLACDEEMVTKDQKRLAEIVEMIHAASLLHDDVIDGASERRGKASANLQFGNRMAILSGDYLLAQASMALAQLGRLPVVELLAQVIKDLVVGEFMQMDDTQQQLEMSHYLEKSYLKTGSLLAKSMQACAMLVDADQPIERSAYEFGKAVGVAFQLIDDCLDYEATEQEAGKPVGGFDLKAGLITAPLLLTIPQAPHLLSLMGQQAAIPEILETVIRMGGVQQTRAMAASLMEEAESNLKSVLTPSPSLTSLLNMARSLINRRF